MELLNRLSFNSEDPEVFIGKIDETLTEWQNQFLRDQAVYTSQCEQFNRDVESSNLNFESRILPEQRKEIQLQINQLKEERVRLQRQAQEQQRLRGTLSTLIETKKKLEHQLLGLVEVSPTEIERLDQELLHLSSQGSILTLVTHTTRKKEELSLLEQKIQKLSLVDSDQIVTEQEITAATLLQDQHTRGSDICRKHKCSYDEQSIQQERNHIQAILDRQPLLQTYQKISLLQKQLLTMTGPNVLEEEVTQARDHLQRLQSAVDIMKCPHCQQPVRFKDRQLMPASISPPSTGEILAAKSELDQKMASRKKTLERDSIITQLTSLQQTLPPTGSNQDPTGRNHSPAGSNQNPTDERVLSPDEITRLRGKLQELSAVKIVEPPRQSPVLLRQILEQQRLQQKQRELQEEIQKFAIPADFQPDKISSAITQTKARLNLLKDTMTKQKLLQTQLQEAEKKLASIVLDDMVETRLQEVTTQIESLEHSLIESEKIDQIYRRRDELTKKQEEVLALHQRNTAIQKLRGIAIEVECHTLQQTVDSINATLADLVSLLFDEPITVTLNTFKTLKNNRSKPNVNLSITYRGGEYDSLNQLSGGEGDRISFALTIALSKLNPCPLLLLDESMASLDANLKEICLHVLENNRQGGGGEKTIFCINHEGTEGDYEEVITLE
jgi:DNA repair exonuclease SbcCD ATPase subunit